jgi:putative DNA primase/helicase
MLASWEGRPVGEPDPETGKFRRLRVNNIHTPVEILEAQHTQADYFDGPVGLAFGDKYLTTELTPTVRRIVTRAHSPDNRATHGYPFPAPRPAVALEAPAFRAYLDSLFAGAEDAQERIALLGEWFGLSLLGLSTRFNKALLLYGPGGSGKGTFLTIIKAVFPLDSVASADPEHWGRGPVMAELAGKRLNLVSDMNHAYDMAEIGRFKAVVSGDLILAEQKYRDPFSFNPVAGHVFSANEDQLPGVPKADPAFWQRWLCVPFTNVFRDTAQDDRGTAERIIAQEQEAIVQWLLSSAAVALEANVFTPCPSGEAVVAEWRGGICSVSLWFHECTRDWEGSSIRLAPSVANVYSDYRAYCAEGGYTPASRNIFTKRLRAISPSSVSRSDGVRLLREWSNRAWTTAPKDPFWE